MLFKNLYQENSTMFRNNKRKKLSFILLYIVLIYLYQVNQLIAQISQEGSPISFSDTTCLPQNSVQCIILPGIDNDSLLTADSIVASTQETKILNFGAPISVNYGLVNSGTLETLSDSTRLWRLHLTSGGSHSSFLIFDKFYIPELAELFIYSEDRSQVLGAFTDKNNKPYGRFSVGPIHSESVIIEYVEPKTIDTVAEINIAAFIHGYKDVFKVHNKLGSSGACNINVFCPLGNGWCNERRSVALIVRLVATDFASICSGALVTNERRDSRPYFLTANHCLQQAPINVNDWLFIFNYQSPTCPNPSGSLATPFVIQGATLRANHEKSDFALLELTRRPPGNFNTFYAGWDNRNDKPQKNGRGIHHPSGDIKKISRYAKRPRKRTRLISGTLVKMWKVKRWAEGTTEGGSSGSPLFSPDKLVVGQLYGGKAACDGSGPNKKSDFYGRFDKSWDKKSGASNQLKPWLNPHGTGNFELAAMSGDEPCKTSYTFINANDLHTSVNIDGLNNIASAGTRTYNGVYEVTDQITASNNVTIQNGTSVEFNAGNLILLRPNFRAVEGCTFRARIEGCLRGCNTGVGKTGYEEDSPFVILSTDVMEEDYIAKEDIIDETSVSERSNSHSTNFSIHPNPTNGKFTLTIAGESKPTVYIYNTLGEIIYRTKLVSSELVVDLSSNPKGIYYIKALSGENVFVEKIIHQ